MKKLILTFLLSTCFFMSGCATVNIPIDSTPLSKDKSTLILFSYTKENRCGSNCLKGPLSGNIMIDGNVVGQLTPKKPLKIAVPNGKHDISVETTENKMNGVITLEFHAGEVYFVRTWVEVVLESMFNNFFSVKMEQTGKIDNYEF